MPLKNYLQKIPKKMLKRMKTLRPLRMQPKPQRKKLKN